MINIDKINNAKIESNPYEWGFIDNLFSAVDKKRLSVEYPTDHFKSVNGYDGEKSYVYECRNLIGMGSNTASYEQNLGASWLGLCRDLLSPDYKNALSDLCKRDLSSVPMEVNVFHYSPGTWMGPHVDLKDKIVTHVLYFNETWDDDQGGCHSILNSNNPNDVYTRISPLTGNSALLIRSNHSWHAVEPVKPGTKQSRRSVTVTFYHPGSVSTMWPPNEPAELHTVSSANSTGGLLRKLIKKLSFVSSN